ncbi:MAG: hypothetical protein IJC17_01775 [Clostridia bacterium]|nr:hypothetical protein [Clostridia bacterium]
MNVLKKTWYLGGRRLIATAMAVVMLVGMLPLSMFVAGAESAGNFAFDSGISGWTGTAAYDGSVGHDAAGSMHLTSSTAVISDAFAVQGGYEYAWGFWYSAKASKSIARMDLIAIDAEGNETTLKGRQAMLSHNTTGYSAWEKVVTYATVPATAATVKLKIAFDGTPVDVRVDDVFCDPISDNISVDRVVDSADTLSLTTSHRIKTMQTGYTYQMTGAATDLPLTLKFYDLADKQVDSLTIEQLPVQFACPASTYAVLSGAGSIGGYQLTTVDVAPLSDTGWQAHGLWYPAASSTQEKPGHFYYFHTKIDLDREKVLAAGRRVKSCKIQVVGKDAVRSIVFSGIAVSMNATKSSGTDASSYHTWEHVAEDGMRSGWAVDFTNGLNQYLNNSNTVTYQDMSCALAIAVSHVTAAPSLVFQGEIVYMDGSVLEIRSGVTHETMVYDGGAGDYNDAGNAIATNPPAVDASGNAWTNARYVCDENWHKAADQGMVPNSHMMDECAFYDEYTARYTIQPTERPTVAATGGQKTTVTVAYTNEFLSALRATDLTGHVYNAKGQLMVTIPVTASFDGSNAKFTFTVPNYVGTGAYDFRIGAEKIALLNADGKEDNIALIDLTNKTNRLSAGPVKLGNTLCTLDLTQPTVSAANSQVAGDQYGNVYLTINGERVSPVLYMMSSGSRYSYDKNISMKDSGLKVYGSFDGSMAVSVREASTGVSAITADECLWLNAAVDGINGVTLAGDAGFVNLDLVDAEIYRALNLNPDGYLLYNLTTGAPEWWKTAHPDDVYDISAYDQSSGQVSTVSFASQEYREDCGAAIKAIAEHIATAPYANRVIGIRLSGGRTAEWMHEVVNYTEDDTTKSHQIDLSTAMLNAFNAKYGLSVTADAIKAALAAEDTHGMLVDLSSSDLALKYNEYLSQIVSETVLHFAEQVKTASNDKLITGAYNGYSWSSNSATVGASHSTVGMLLESEYIDYISGPADYSERITGYKTGYMALSESVKAHGKLYMVEQDNRTVYMTEITDDGSTDSVGHTDTVYDGVHQLWRDFTTDMVNGVGFWGYDMLGGWYNDPAFTDMFAKLKAAYDASLDDDTRSNSQVAVWLDYQNFDYVVNTAFSANSTATDSFALFKQLHVDLRKELAKLGTSYDVYAIEDVDDTLSAEQLDHYKVHLVVSPLQLSTSEREAINTKFKKDGKTVVWLYLPGLSQDNGAWNIANVESLTDFDITLQAKGSSASKLSTTNGVAMGNTAVPTVASYGGTATGSPRATIADGTALATYVTGGETSVAYKKLTNYTSVYSAAPYMPVELLRAICTDAGVHLYTDDLDLIVDSNASYLSVNSLTSGQKTITLPEAQTMRDVLTGKIYDGATYTLDMDAADTVLLTNVQPEDTWDDGLIPNGSFESNSVMNPTSIDGWMIGNNGNVERSYDDAYGDSWYSLKATAPFSVATKQIAVKPNTTYTLTFSHKGGAADWSHTVRAQCYDAAGAALFADFSAYVWSGGMADDWTTVTLAFTTTASTKTLSILFNAQGGSSASAVSYWDNFSLVEHVHADTNSNYLCDTVFPLYRALQEGTTTQATARENYTCGYDLEQPEFVGVNMTLGETLQMNMAIDVHNTDPEDVKVVLDALPEYSVQTEAELTLDEQADANGYYYIHIRVPAAHLQKDFTATLYVNDQAVTYSSCPTKTYSAEEYALTVVNGQFTAAEKATATAMLNYGAWAQMYFGEDTDDLANAKLNAADRFDAGERDAFADKIGTALEEDQLPIIRPDGSEYSPLDSYKAITTNKIDSFLGYTMLMQDSFGLRLYFTENVTVTLDGEAAVLTEDADSERYYLEIGKQTARQLTDKHTVTATDTSSQTMTITNLSILTPARTVIRSSKQSENYRNMCTALILYAEAVGVLAAE